MKAMPSRFARLLVVPMFLAACETAPAENPEQPSVTATSDSSPPATATTTTSEPVATSTAPTATETAAPKPAAKPAKELLVGKWQFSFEGEPKAKEEEALKKKYPKEKDAPKLAEALKKKSDEAAGEWIEFVDSTYVSHITEKGKDKIVFKAKYEISKEEGNKLTLKPVGKEEISKKEMKDEHTVTLVDDNTLNMYDEKKKMTLVFKRKT